MFTRSISPSVAFPQPFLRDTGSADNHSKKNEALEDRYPKNRGDASYQPTARQDAYQADKAGSTMAVQSIVTSTNHTAEIQVTTQQGDVVTIRLNEAASSSSASFEMQQGNKKITINANTQTRESGFSMSIEGDLNEKEEKALATLIDKMAKVSEEFFSGDINAAFKHAQKIGFDSDQIAGFSMDLNRQQSVQAVAAYQQTALPDQNVDTSMLEQARDFLAETKAFMADTASLLDSLAEPKQAFGDLFAGVGELYHVPEEASGGITNESLFLKMIENVANDMFGNTERL